MSLKTSFYNKSILKSDIKRFWWVGVLETLLIFVTAVWPLYNNLITASHIGSSYYYSRTEPQWFNGSIVWIIIFAVGVATLLLSYMHFSSSMSGHHCLPVKRSKLFSSKLISGAVLTIVPILLNAVALACIIINPQFRQFYGLAHILKWTLTGILYTLVLFSLTSFVNMMTGNPIGTLIFTYGFAALPFVIVNFFQSFFAQEVYGYVYGNATILEYIYIDEKNLLDAPYFIIYLVLTALFLAGAFRLYKIRRLETHGEVISFGWLKPVFIAIVSLLSTMVSYFYFMGVLGRDNLLYLLPFGIAGTIIAWMVSRKSLRINGIYKPVLIYSAATLVFCAVIHFDLTGYERRVPDIDDIKSVTILNSNNVGKIYVDDGYVNYRIVGKISPDFTDEKDIAGAIALHKHLIENRFERQKGDYTAIPIRYTLKNGKTLVREYDINYEKDALLLKPLYETRQVKAERLPLTDGGQKTFTSLMISDRRIHNSNQIWKFYPDNPQMQKLLEALKKDLAEVSYEEYILNEGASINISMEYDYTFVYDEELPEDITKGYTHNYDTYAIRTSYKNTLAALEEIGFTDMLPGAEDIQGATITTWETKDGEDLRYVKDTYVPDNSKETNVTDPDSIKLLYTQYDNMIEKHNFSDYQNRYNIRIAYRLNSGNVFEVSCSYDEDKIPEVLKPYF